jgi:hypothetical protein
MMVGMKAFAERVTMMTKTTKINVFLDDLRACPAGFVLARSAEDCITLMENYDVAVLSLDHDLGWDSMNGSDLAQELVARGLYADEIFLHSSSMAGRANMYTIFMQKKPEHVRISMQPVPSSRLHEIEFNQ